MGWLLKLPCPFDVRSMGTSKDGSVQEYFVRESRAVTSLDALREFAQRWLAVWDSDDPRDAVVPEELTDGVFHQFKRLQEVNAKFDPEDDDQSIAVRLLLPRRLLETSMLAHHFGAPFNVALIQRWGDDEDRKEAF